MYIHTCIYVCIWHMYIFIYLSVSCICKCTYIWMHRIHAPNGPQPYPPEKAIWVWFPFLITIPVTLHWCLHNSSWHSLIVHVYIHNTTHICIYCIYVLICALGFKTLEPIVVFWVHVVLLSSPMLCSTFDPCPWSRDSGWLGFTVLS